MTRRSTPSRRIDGSQRQSRIKSVRATRRCRPTPELLATELPKIVRQYGQPNSATMASWLVCLGMQGDIKVALTGDGPDELFGSYFVHRAVAALTRARATGDVADLAELPDAERAFAEQNWDSSLAQIYEAFAVFPGGEQQALPSAVRAAGPLSTGIDGGGGE